MYDVPHTAFHHFAFVQQSSPILLQQITIACVHTTQHSATPRHATKTIEVHRQSDVITASIPGISRKFQHFKYFSERDNTSSDHLQNVCTVKIEPKRFRE